MDRGRVFTLKSDIMRMVMTTLEEERVSYSLPSSKQPQARFALRFRKQTQMR